MNSVLFRVDSSSYLGGGHLSRCIELARYFAKKDHKIYFLCKNLDGNLNFWIESEKFKLLTINKEILDLESELKETEYIFRNYKKFTSLIVDHYNLDNRWENKMRKFADKIIVIDDLANRKHDCDILIDQNLYADMESRYERLVGKETIKLLSPKYAILKDEFYRFKSEKKSFNQIKNLFICFGATDPKNHTLATLQALRKINYKFNSINIYTTVGNKNLASIKKESKKISNCSLHCDNRDLAKILSKADLAIGAGGTMCWERAYFGIPTIAFAVAKNQVENLSTLIKDGIVVGESTNLKPDPKKIEYWLKMIIKNKIYVKKLSQKSKELVDGLGIQRIYENIYPTNYIFRFVNLGDSENLFNWRNSITLRSISYDKKVFDYESHLKWLNKKLSDKNVLFLIAEFLGKPIGVIRFEIEENEATISIYKVPKSPKSFGLIKKSSMWLFFNYPQIKKIRAKILSDNEKSYKAFSSAGFKGSTFRMYLENKNQ